MPGRSPVWADRPAANSNENKAIRILKKLRPFNREQVEFCGGAARRGEAAGFSTGRQYPMARDDDWNGIATERLSDRARGRRIAEPRGDLAVGQRLARGNRPRHVVHA